MPACNAAPATCWKIRILGCALMAMAITLGVLLICLWPAHSDMPPVNKAEAGAIVEKPGSASAATVSPKQPNAAAPTDKAAGEPGQKPANWLDLNPEQRILLLVMIAGALGSFVHIATSFAEFVGDGEFRLAWIWWYLLKPFTSMALAAIFYLVLRGGLMAPEANGGAVNLYGVVAMAGMVGMFSKQATMKLAEVFDTLFRSHPKGGNKPDEQNGNPDEQVLADAAELNASATPGQPNPPETPDEQLPAAKGGVQS